ncbi:transcription factor bHLH118-like [Solanum pennellii]|uniref:Transcription factor bHLH118-like n=1 Tax=Solanum pennellii TaxID=28526 RepID=A0ABM1GMC5_SOLPN|nr:transcription factor bHLH118-like [Solanum pennellii]
MDCLSEIFSSKKIKDHDQQQLIQIPSTPCQPHHQDLPTNDPNYKRKRSISDHKERDSLTRKNSVQKKVLHRDVERHRRQEMSNLYATLRSHLPYIKGKRSLPDDMQEAVNQIKNLENNIKELEIKRKKLEDLVLCSSKEDKHFGDYVKINLCDCGVEILINERIPLSRVLEELVKRQLNVVSCVSTKVDERLLHRIQIEESDVSCMCMDGLEQKLAEMIVFHS